MTENELEKYVEFIASILKDRNYKIDYYSCYSFHAHYKDKYSKCIEVHTNLDKPDVRVYSDISLSSRGRTKEECVKEFSKMYDEVQLDIDYVNHQLDNVYSTDNTIRMLQLCGVPKNIIEDICLKLNNKESE